MIFKGVVFLIILILNLLSAKAVNDKIDELPGTEDR